MNTFKTYKLRKDTDCRVDSQCMFWTPLGMLSPFLYSKLMRGKSKRMKTETRKEQYAASTTAMSASSKEQNRSLKRGLSRQELSLQQCHVMIRKEQVVARAVIYDEHSYIGNLALEVIEQTEAN